jgi:hypothetical protein
MQTIFGIVILLAAVLVIACAKLVLGLKCK